jgi:hypothetical protein
MTGIRHPVSGIRYPVSGIWHPASGIRHLASENWPPTSIPLSAVSLLTPEKLHPFYTPFYTVSGLLLIDATL